MDCVESAATEELLDNQKMVLAHYVFIDQKADLTRRKVLATDFPSVLPCVSAGTFLFLPSQYPRRGVFAYDMIETMRFVQGQVRA